ncbi:hypothetical protein HELRODRAFT_181074 [Helobdella robusta]|uniref:DH domain-containing protein n=1 Tax=Helobdella robusta TaxID=6412 RepID=T1FGL0_HELRO|nr:hypothetical protein HELRODRAFT_181074 [Helobdella robusta]ESN93328.1 hypothetical protein HELRODRAFT_181074 [Helobdella robusta]
MEVRVAHIVAVQRFTLEGRTHENQNIRGRRFALLTDDASSLLDVSTDGNLLKSSSDNSTTSPTTPANNNNSRTSLLSSQSGLGALTERASSRGSSRSANVLQSLFNPFVRERNGSKQSQDKTDQLNDFLTTYTLVSLPHLPDSITRGRLKFNPNSLYMESHWTDIVVGHEKFNKRERDQQEVIWEMLTTEVEYIRKLKVIIDLFYSCLIHLQSNQLLTEIEIDKVFSNIYEVFNATNHFWSCHMIQLLKDSRQKREQLNFCLLKSGFGIPASINTGHLNYLISTVAQLKLCPSKQRHLYLMRINDGSFVFDTIFKPYIEYCLDQEKCRDYLKTKMKENELFRTFITRITRYALLLGALKKTLEKMERNADVKQKIEDITKMVGLCFFVVVVVGGGASLILSALHHYTYCNIIYIDARHFQLEQVDSFVVKVNGVMRQRQEHIQLSTMMSRIDSYDVVEVPSDECSSIVSQHCKLDLTMPVPGCGHHVTRKILFEGSLKLKDTYNKMDVYCFLFTDMLLITKPSTRRGDRVKVIKPPMRLDKIVVQSMRDVGQFGDFGYLE